MIDSLQARSVVIADNEPGGGRRVGAPAPATLDRALSTQDRVERFLLEKSLAVFAPTRAIQSNGHAESLYNIHASAKRLRAGLQLFSELFDADELRQVQRQLRRITHALAAIRVLDMNLLLLRRATRRLPVSGLVARVALQPNLLVERAVRLAVGWPVM